MTSDITFSQEALLRGVKHLLLLIFLILRLKPDSISFPNPEYHGNGDKRGKAVLLIPSCW
jgi:hypothetical protein